MLALVSVELYILKSPSIVIAANQSLLIITTGTGIRRGSSHRYGDPHSTSTGTNETTKSIPGHARFGSSLTGPSRFSITTHSRHGLNSSAPGRDTVQRLSRKSIQCRASVSQIIFHDGRGTRRPFINVSWRMRLHPLQTDYLVANI
jgi:hypothetical protein